jgi:hypothetical protein
LLSFSYRRDNRAAALGTFRTVVKQYLADHRRQEGDAVPRKS